MVGFKRRPGIQKNQEGARNYGGPLGAMTSMDNLSKMYLHFIRRFVWYKTSSMSMSISKILHTQR